MSKLSKIFTASCVAAAIGSATFAIEAQADPVFPPAHLSPEAQFGTIDETAGRAGTPPFPPAHLSRDATFENGERARFGFSGSYYRPETPRRYAIEVVFVGEFGKRRPG